MQSTNPEHTQGFSVSNPFTRYINYCPHDVPWEKVTNAEALRTHCLRRGLLDDRDVPALQQRLKEYQQAHKDENEDRGVPWRLTPDEVWILASATRTRCQLIRVVDESYVGSWGRWLEKRFTLYTRRLGLFTLSRPHLNHRSQWKTKLRAYPLRSPPRSSLPGTAPLAKCVSSGGAGLHLCRQPFFLLFPQPKPRAGASSERCPFPSVQCLEIFNSVRKPSQPNICVLCEDEKHWACPQWVCSPQSEPEKWIDKEHMDKSLHETKLAAMLNYEYKSRRHK
ncbi:uncharacterized protein B0T23DRAFT_325798 [Neurospora hispaniola]|uniref:Uncharacterized protein n=1 Tax=Neurospora hispaniola TaxID=588809 RepID=A0AAJ0HZL3_9PEZI|nr:hypothetical protein B0T23DRAFT_325798 [Neurospora hispaniola]